MVDGIAVNNIVLVDKGSKKGLSDHCLARDARNIAQDVLNAGLRVRAAVIISSDSDFSAAGVYDALNEADVRLVIIHADAIRPALLRTATAMRTFLHKDDLFDAAPAPAALLLPVAAAAAVPAPAASTTMHPRRSLSPAAASMRSGGGGGGGDGRGGEPSE